MNENVIAFARSQGYAGAEYAGKWEHYDVYDRVFHGEENLAPGEYMCVGPPLVILADGDEIRMSTEEEAFAYLGSLPDEYEDEDEDD